MENSGEDLGSALELGGAAAKKKKAARRRRLGIALGVLAALGVAGGAGAWMFLSAEPEMPETSIKRPSAPAPGARKRSASKDEQMDPAAVDVTASGGRRPGQQGAGRGSQQRPGSAPLQTAQRGGAPAGVPGATPPPGLTPLPTSEDAARPRNPLDVQGATDMMAGTEEMRLKTAYMKEVANYNRAQTDAVNESMKLMQAQALAASGGLPDGAHGGHAGGMSKADVERLIAEARKGSDGEKKKSSPPPIDRSASGRITGVQGTGGALWASARTLDGDIVRLDVGSRWNGGRVSSITKDGVTVKHSDGHVQRFPF